MRQIELLIEAYLMAERDLVAVVDAAGGTVPLSEPAQHGVRILLSTHRASPIQSPTSSSDMIVDRFEFSIDRLERDLGKRAKNAGMRLPLQCSFECTVRPDSVPAICATDDRVVGQMVGHTEAGAQAIRALYLDDQGSLRHGPLLTIKSRAV
jgi:hypothetical protein